MSEEQRRALGRLVDERGEDYAGLSRLLGRNPAYIQQFIKRGVPRKLAEDDRRTLAAYFRVDEAVLGGPSKQVPRADNGLIRISRLDVDASAGPGAFPDEQGGIGDMAFDKSWLRRIAGGDVAGLSLIRVRGDSMAPTLTDGDDILVNQSDSEQRIRDGIYVLRREDALLVKRLAMSPSPRRVTVRSDNLAYPSWTDIDLAEIKIIGRVIWAGRRL